MVQKTSPWVGAAYGWPYGENGWNDGMDENLLKFSYLFNRNVDSITDTLPLGVVGQAHYLTTDNRIYYFVDGLYKSTEVPKWFKFFLKSTGQTWQFNGTTVQEVATEQQNSARLDSVETTLESLGTAAYEDASSFASQSELDVASAQAAAYTDTLREDLSTASLAVDSVYSLINNVVADASREYLVTGYHAGTSVGGGRFVWVASQVKSAHDGGMIISPTVPWDGTQGTLGDFLAGVGETDPSGVGCFVRVLSGDIYVSWFGAKGDNISDDTASIQAAADYIRLNRTQISPTAGQTAATTAPCLRFEDGVFRISSQVNISYYDHLYGNNSVIKALAGFTGDYAFSANFGGWEFRIRGLSFDGFNQHLYLNNNNTDQGIIVLDEMKFYGGSKAIHLNAQSSVTHITNTKIDRSLTALYVESGDKVVVDSSWVKQGTLTADRSASIYNYGNSLVIQNSIFVPIPATGVETAWINNYNTLQCVNNRFGGENGSKTIVNNYATGETVAPVSPNGVSLLGNEIYNVDGVGAARGAIRFFNVPNFVIARDNYGFADSVLMSFSTTVDPFAQVAALGRKNVWLDIGDNFSGQASYSGILEQANYIHPAFFSSGSRDNGILFLSDANTTLSTGQNGWVVTNSSLTTANANVYLPAARSGMTFSAFRDNGTFLMRLRPNGTDSISTGTAGQYLQMDTNKIGVTLTCFVNGKWEITSLTGTSFGTGYSFV